jgi:hypothetical protein
MLRLIVNLSPLADALAGLRESQRRVHRARPLPVFGELLAPIEPRPADG